MVSPAATRRSPESLGPRAAAPAEIDSPAGNQATLGDLLDVWFPLHHAGPSTTATYASLINSHVRPGLGAIPLLTLHRSASTIPEDFYAELLRCSRRCGGRRPDHKCVPLAVSSVRLIHNVVSRALTAAVRWEWLPNNPAKTVRSPAKPVPDRRPPSASDAARMIEETWRQDKEWCLYLWLTMVLGIRRSELVALRWGHVDLDAGQVSIRRSYVGVGGAGYDKDLKVHRVRCLDVDPVTLRLLVRHRRFCVDLLELADTRLGPDHLVFSGSPDLLRQREPNSMTSRYRALVGRLGIESHQLHDLPQYSAAELIDAGVTPRW